ncbi:MAG: tRNA (guanosine(37)-N1)-methyltransferase TrmD [Candidatus Omnitrophica bacterium]|nr:tRNA (guanosine(37)-N1)-methyltransferase TrmD [Candidatus Omnitrophota bacterium]MDD5351879.1 tRNA (guanosine(37)-N1)-methyltransferase TrmD [Candidatus Omnitrophota bacterium]MDD5550705.1 tRNA (guanosine(37)-N1)-methyltransferase TrmD [Candidatus Omnitrophota bacterium]
MKIDIITIFPEIFDAVLNESILKRAQAKGLVEIYVHNLRDYSGDKHRKVDDRPFGGGPGMVFSPEPLFKAVEHIKACPRKRKWHGQVILLSPQGKTLNQKMAQKLSKDKHLVLICGHYEGIDERVRLKLVDEEISIGDYVLTGGELPAMVLVDAVVRLVKGVLGDEDSSKSDSFSDGLLEYPHYTRPANFKGMKVPKVLLSGDHEIIAKWRKDQSLKVTKKKRPELIK